MTLFENIRDKKQQLRNHFMGAIFNHPNRLASVDFSGSVSFSQSNAQHSFSGSFDVNQSFTRNMVEKNPWFWGNWPPTPGEKEFTLGHSPVNPWGFDSNRYGSLPFSVPSVGSWTNVINKWDGSAWVYDRTDSGDFDYHLYLTISGGARPDSLANVWTYIEWSANGAYTLSGLGGSITERPPWSNSWASESGIMPTAFTAGSSSVSVSFT